MIDNIEQSLDIQCLFCQKWHIAPLPSPKWITQSFPVLAMLTSGSGKIVIDGSQTVHSLKPQQPYFLPANLKRCPQADHPNGLEVLAVGFQVKILGGIDLLNFLEIPLFLKQANNERIGELMPELYALESHSDDNWIQRAVAKKRICDELIEKIIASASFIDETALTASKNFHCTPAVKYLNDNFTAPLNVPRLMKLCNLSRTHFFRLFKKQTNTTPFEYIKRRRLQEAQNMLLSTSLSVTEVGVQVGWEDSFHFSRIFKKATGLSPEHYREQFKKKYF